MIKVQKFRPKIVEYFVDAHIEIVSCFGGSKHSACIDSNGNLFMFGCGFSGQLGLGKNKSKEMNAIPRQVDWFNDKVIKTVSLGNNISTVIAFK